MMYEELLNGSSGMPPIAAVTSEAGAPAAGQDQTRVATSLSNPSTILMAWLILFALLVLAHVVTLSLQR